MTHCVHYMCLLEMGEYRLLYEAIRKHMSVGRG